MDLRLLFSRPAVWLFVLLTLSFNMLMLNAISATVAPSILIEHDSGLAVDHIAFWAAGALANQGDPAAAYDPVALAAAQSAGLGYEFRGGLPWFYPPLAQLMAQPFALLSPGWSLVVWNVLGLAAFGWAAWRILPDALAVMLACASGGVVSVLFNGQIGLFIAAIAALCLLALRDGKGGGGWLALLLLKPQTVFAIPVTLATAGRWRPVLIACGVGAALIAASAIWLGVEVWLTFLSTLTGTADYFLADPAGDVFWPKYASLYGVALHNGVPVWLAALAQGGLSVAALALATLALKRQGPTDAALAVILYAAVIAAPRIYVYDLPLLALGALFHARAVMARGWTRWEPPVFAAAFLSLEAAFITTPHIAVLAGPMLMVAVCLRHVKGAPSLPHCN